MHHQSVNKSLSGSVFAALRSLVSSIFKRGAFHDVVIPAHLPVIPAHAGIPQIPASRRNDNQLIPSYTHHKSLRSQLSAISYQLSSPHLLLTLLILPFIFALDLFYFTLARPGCAACGSLSGFLSTSSLTMGLWQLISTSLWLPVLPQTNEQRTSQSKY